MSDVIRAKRAEIEIGGKVIEVFQLPNGDYRLSQTQVAEAVGNGEHSFRQFLNSKPMKPLRDRGFRSDKLPIEGNNTPIKPIPISLALAYWSKEAIAKNPEAIRLTASSLNETIQRRADVAFGIVRSEKEYNKLFKTTFESLGLEDDEFRQLRDCVNESELYNDASFKVIRPLLNHDYKNPVFGMTEDEFRDDLASLSSRTKRWRLKIEDELEFMFEGERERSYPDLTSDVFLCSACLDGKEQRVVFVFECKNPIVKVSHIKECIYDRMYLEAAREKYETENVFLFFVAPLGGEPKAHSYVKKRLADDDEDYVHIITVKKMAEFLKNQVATTNPSKKAEITKRYRKLLNYQICKPLPFALSPESKTD